MPLIREMLQGLSGVAVVIACCALVVLALRLLCRASGELSRKLLHFSVIAVLTALLYTFDRWIPGVLTMAVFVLLVYPILWVLEKHQALGFLSRVASEREGGELRKSLCAAGLMYILVVAIAWGALGSRPIALASIYAWGPGDAAAALIGKRYGHHRLGRARKKSLEGSLAMFALSFLSVLAILLISGSFSVWTAVAAALLTASVTTAVEFFELHGLDTLFCPLAALAILSVFQLLFGGR